MVIFLEILKVGKFLQEILVMMKSFVDILRILGLIV